MPGETSKQEIGTGTFGGKIISLNDSEDLKSENAMLRHELHLVKD